MSSKQGPRIKAGMRTPAHSGRIAYTTALISYAMGKEAM